MHSSFDFVGIHMRDFKFGLKHELHTLFDSIHESVEAGIWDGRYEIGNRNVRPPLSRIISPSIRKKQSSLPTSPRN